MGKKNIGRNNQKKKIIQLHEKRPLLKSLDIELLISTISPEEIQETREVLKEYLEGFKHVDTEKKIILAYLFGELQRFDDMYSEQARKSLADKITKVYKTGFHWGYILATLHFPQGGNNNCYDNPGSNIKK